MAYPYTGYDLKEIGKLVEKITRKLKWAEVDSGDPLEPFVTSLVIEVGHPEDSGTKVGEIRFVDDGWLGFFPEAVDG